MKKKIIALCAICMFLLMSLATVTVVGKKAAKEVSDLGADLAVEFSPILNDDNVQTGFIVKVKNIGTESVKGYISGNYRPYRGFNKLIPMFKYWRELTILENEQELKPGEEINVVECHTVLAFWPGIHINHFVFKLNFDDENLDNNIYEQTAMTVFIPFYYERMYFI